MVEAKQMLSFSCVLAVSRNNGIGFQNRIPWPRLRTDLKNMAKLTTETCDPQKQNVVIMGRRTWESIPEHVRPLKNRLNVVLTSKPSSDLPGAHFVYSSLANTMAALSEAPMREKFESIFILGGSSVYEEALLSPRCDKVYYTDIMGEYPCDTFVNWSNRDQYELIKDTKVPQGIIEENGVKYEILVYQRKLVQS